MNQYTASRFLKFVGLDAICILLLSACASSPPIKRIPHMYEGPECSTIDLALLSCSEYLDIERVDNMRTTAREFFLFNQYPGFGDFPAKVYLLPGQHIISVEFSRPVGDSSYERKYVYIQIPVTVEKGKSYIIKSAEYGDNVSLWVEPERVSESTSTPVPLSTEPLPVGLNNSHYTSDISLPPASFPTKPDATIDTSAYEQLLHLKELKDKGIVTDDEYEQRRKALIDQL